MAHYYCIGVYSYIVRLQYNVGCNKHKRSSMGAVVMFLGWVLIGIHVYSISKSVLSISGSVKRRKQGTEKMWWYCKIADKRETRTELSLLILEHANFMSECRDIPISMIRESTRFFKYCEELRLKMLDIK